jgi:hypothetical protein
MYPSAKVVEVIGRYAGLSGIIFLIFAITIITLSKSRGTPEQKERRLSVLAGLVFIFGICALISGRVARTSLLANRTTASYETSGKLSPIAPNNCGSITITDKSSTTDQEKK